MTCHKPITAWKRTKSNLFTDSLTYFKSKKISFKYRKGYEKIEIPCGKCLGCRLDHANSWATRIMLEAKEWKNCCVVSLTYNDPHLPFAQNGKTTLRKKDLQDFMKLLRYYEKGIESWTDPKTNKEEKPIRFFACGEYGNNGTRTKLGGNPHFHVIFFNWIPNDLKLYKLNKHGDKIFKSKKLQKIWGKGFCTVEELNYNTACYVARYVQKKAGIPGNKREYTGEYDFTVKVDERNGNQVITTRNKIKERSKSLPELEFINMSRRVGIGKTYWLKNKKYIKMNKGILIKINRKVKLKQIPRYFKKLWEDEDWYELYEYKYRSKIQFENTKQEILKKLKLPDDWNNQQKWEWHLKKQEEILKNKAKYLKRDNFI